MLGLVINMERSGESLASARFRLTRTRVSVCVSRERIHMTRVTRVSRVSGGVQHVPRYSSTVYPDVCSKTGRLVSQWFLLGS